MMKNRINHTLILALLTFWLSNAGHSQTINTFSQADSAELSTVIQKILESHPSILKAQEVIHSADAGINLAKSAYYPDIDLGATYSRIGPTPSITIPNMGSFDMAPANNYNASFNVRELLYDFSKTQKNIQLAQSNKELAVQNVELLKSKLVFLAITDFYSISYLQEAVQIKKVELGILEQHLDFVTRKKETGSATDYEVLSTRVRISNAKNQLLDLESSLSNQRAILNSLLGLPEETVLKVKEPQNEYKSFIQYDSLLNYALDHRVEMILSELKHRQAELKYSTIKIENNPVITAFASGGIKNGYFPELNNPKANYAGGLGIKVPIFTATRHKSMLQLANSEITSSTFDIEQNRREISSEVFQNMSNLQVSQRKIDQSILQMEQASEARRLADLSFRAGTITNLDLLDAESLEAESTLNLIRAKTEYKINAAKLEISIGKKGY